MDNRKLATAAPCAALLLTGNGSSIWSNNGESDARKNMRRRSDAFFGSPLHGSCVYICTVCCSVPEKRPHRHVTNVSISSTSGLHTEERIGVKALICRSYYRVATSPSVPQQVQHKHTNERESSGFGSSNLSLGRSRSRLVPSSVRAPNVRAYAPEIETNTPRDAFVHTAFPACLLTRFKRGPLDAINEANNQFPDAASNSASLRSLTKVPDDCV